MEQNEILEGNRIISEFMGFKKYENKILSDGERFNAGATLWVKNPTDRFFSDGGIYLETELKYCDEWFSKPKYRLSWDALVPVLEKIRSMVEDGTVDVSEPLKLFQLTIFAAHQTTWKAVVEFIKWQNSQSEKNKA